MKKFYFALIIFLTSFGAFAQPSIDNSFFEHVQYRGAFGNVDWTDGWTNFNPQQTNYPATTVTVNAGEITGNVDWTANNVYLLNGFVYVRSGAVLNIQAGTIIRGDKTNKGTIIVEQGGKINAIGTASNPIVFTSNQAVGSRNRGDWGGIIVLGYSSINQAGGVSVIEGGVGSTYGGGTTPNVNDNSGTLKYVRIEFPGIAFEPNNEINGLTLGGVGAGTTLDYIQVSYSGDDSYEWFGGTVNAKHLVAFVGLDDDFDTDNGFQGMVQFAVALRDPAIADEAGDSNGFESDNDATGSPNQPYTQAIFCNCSMFGPLATLTTPINDFYKRGMYIRRNSRLNIYNTVVAGWKIGLQIKDQQTQDAATANILKIENTLISGAIQDFNSDFEQNYFLSTDPARDNMTYVSNDDIMISDPFNLTNPDFMPETGSPVLTGSYWYYVGIASHKQNNNLSVSCQPNPFKGHTELVINAVEMGPVTVDIYNLSGAKVATLFDGQVFGQQKISFEAGNLSKGIYVARVNSNSETKMVKLIVQ